MNVQCRSPRNNKPQYCTMIVVGILIAMGVGKYHIVPMLIYEYIVGGNIHSTGSCY